MVRSSSQDVSAEPEYPESDPGMPLRCLGERGFALLNQRWRTPQHITASPSRIGDIARAALVLTHFEHGYIT